MLRSKLQRSVVAPLLLGGLIWAGPFSMSEAWDGLWSGVSGWLGGSQAWSLATSEYSSGIDPNGRPDGATTGSADSEYSSGIDPLGRQ
jgi:hypothetical protein